MSTYFVLYVRPYDFKADDGRQVQGATVTYLDLDMQPERGELGHAPLQVSIDHDTARGFTEAPGFYDLSFRQRRGRDGKPQLVLANAKLIARAPLAELVGG